MTTIDEAKAMARRLRTGLNTRGYVVTHSESLELVAEQIGFHDWNTASARLGNIHEAEPTPEAERSMGKIRSHKEVIEQMRETRARMTAYYEENPDPRSVKRLAGINQRIAETERRFEAWSRMAHEWETLGVYRPTMKVPMDPADVLERASEWKKTGNVDLAHPEEAFLIFETAIYNLEVGDRTVRFAAREVDPGIYALYLPKTGRHNSASA